VTAVRGPVPPAPPGARLPVVVAPLRPRDLPNVLRIEGEVFDEPWSRQLFQGELAQRTSRSYRAAWVGSELVGYAGQMSVDDEAHVNNIAVAPGWVGRRLGTALLYDLVRTALTRGSAHLTLEVAVGNEAAIALYRRFGLAPVGVRPNYYQDGDALIMWVRDIDSDDYALRLAAIGSTLAEAVDLERRP
jgi:[ribosomal protein S18]-alanine N-acetyltransferase